MVLNTLPRHLRHCRAWRGRKWRRWRGRVLRTIPPPSIVGNSQVSWWGQMWTEYYYTLFKFMVGGGLVVGVTWLSRYFDPKYGGILIAAPIVITLSFILTLKSYIQFINRRLTSSPFSPQRINRQSKHVFSKLYCFFSYRIINHVVADNHPPNGRFAR